MLSANYKVDYNPSVFFYFDLLRSQSDVMAVI